jgi:hypothetical protein
MMSLISPAEAAMPERARFAAGASLFGGCAAVSRVRLPELAAVGTPAADVVLARPRPQASPGSVFFGSATHAAGQPNSARQQRTSQKYAAHTTRIAAAGGGALGPHPARDPV